MDIIIFIPMSLILLFVFCVLGGIHILLESLSKIFYNVFSVVFVILGLVTIVVGIVKAKKEKGFIYGVVESLRGIFITFALPGVKYFLDLGSGHTAFRNAEYIFLGKFELLDIYTASLLLAVVIIAGVTLPVILMRKKTGVLCAVMTLSVILAVSSLLYNIGIASEFNNNYDLINWESPEYEVTCDTAIKHDAFFFNPVKTGKFKEGTQLYAGKHSSTYRGIEHRLVSDGEKMGYVSIEHMKSLVGYKYVVNADSDLYGVRMQTATMVDSNGERKEMSVNAPDDNIIARVSSGTEVTKIGSHAEKLKVIQYLIQLPDGTQGYIAVENVTEIRE